MGTMTYILCAAAMAAVGILSFNRMRVDAVLCHGCIFPAVHDPANADMPNCVNTSGYTNTLQLPYCNDHNGGHPGRQNNQRDNRGNHHGNQPNQGNSNRNHGGRNGNHGDHDVNSIDCGSNYVTFSAGVKFVGPYCATYYGKNGTGPIVRACGSPINGTYALSNGYFESSCGTAGCKPEPYPF